VSAVITNCYFLVDNCHKRCSFPFQVIIPGSWIFSVILNLPWFLFLEVQDGYCKNVPMYGQNWIPRAYSLLFSTLVAVSVVMMAGLYSRIVYTLWLKRVENNQPAFQQRVSTSNNTNSLNMKESFVSASPKRVSSPRGCSSEILKRTSKGYQDPFCGRGLNTINPRIGASPQISARFK